ncbi:DNRLRE domain-containing protein [Nocardioides sp.]|uniref:DNRLRE domain-containing protein n=1 Tax=Nocardioides sp. TaxID=35761 RepID=UPI0019839A87|nr:DNRLRE domain-containing protein [Nocardioides sp.]MBC7274911.1 DNRLRE domain-containing protein [Nocardioides sp.]
MGEDKKLAPKAKGSRVTVADVFGDADLDYSVGAGVLKEDIVLPNATAAPADGFTFTLDTKGLVAKPLAEGVKKTGEATGGAIGLFTSEKAKRPRLVLPAPYMTDGSDERSDAVSQVLGQTADGTTTVTITPDADWLQTKGRRFPVRVDPTIVYAPDATDGKDAAIYSGDTLARPADPTIPVGVANGGLWRGLFQFDTTAIPAGSTVYGAQLRLYMSAPHTNQGSPVKMNAYPIAKEWDEATATWANMGTDGHDETPPRVSEPLHYNWFTVDDGDAGATSFTGPWKEIHDVSSWGQSYSSPTSGTTPDTFDWNARLPWAGSFDVDARVPPRTGQGSPTYEVTGDQPPTVSTTVNQTQGGLYKSLSKAQHFSPGATARVRLIRQSGTGAPATTPMADAIRWMEYATATKGATQYDAWQTYGLGSMVQKWIDSPATNYGVLVKAENEDRATAPLGGPNYHSSDAPFANGTESDTRPQLVIVLGKPGPTQDVPTTVHADGPELSWSQAVETTYAQGDDVAEYQIFRGCVSLPQAACTTPVGEDFTTEYARNGALKLVGTVPADTTTPQVRSRPRSTRSS